MIAGKMIDKQLSAFDALVSALPVCDDWRLQILRRSKSARKNDSMIETPVQIRARIAAGSLDDLNRNGHDIYIRPQLGRLILLDDIPNTSEALAKLDEIGLQPVAVVMSSWHKLNVVVDLGGCANDLEIHKRAQRIAVERAIAAGLPADRAAANGLQIWRLPQFVNEKRHKDGKYVHLLHDRPIRTRLLSVSPGRIADAAAQIVREARNRFEHDQIKIKSTASSAPSAPAAMHVAAGGGETKIVNDPERYAVSALTRAANEIRNTTENRNSKLVANAFAIFRFVAGGAIDNTSAWTALFEAAVDCGLESNEIDHALVNASLAASRQPRFLRAAAA
jgi:hypothetical protein